MKLFCAILGKFETCRYVEKRLEDWDIWKLRERIKPFQKEGYAIIDIWDISL